MSQPARLFIVLTCLVAAIACVCQFSVANQASRSASKWEYKMEELMKHVFDERRTEIWGKELNELADEGWEIVSASPLPTGKTVHLFVTMKRRKD